MSRTVLMVMVDSLRHDEVRAETMPFLHALAQSGTQGSLAPSFGFEPDGAYLAGLTPEACDGGAQFWRRPGDQLFHGAALWGLLHQLPLPALQRLVRKGTRATAQWLAQDPLPRRMASPAFIPYDQLARFSLSLKHMPDDPLAYAGRSLFDLARSRQLHSYVHCFPRHRVKTDIVRSRYLLEDRGQHDFCFLFLGDLDGIGHAHGPHSEPRRAMLQRIDQALADIWAHARRQYGEVALAAFGDHGMAEVRGHVDIRPALAAADLKAHRDSWFIDSTFARFWVGDEARRQRLTQALARLKGGRLISDADRAAWHIRWPHDWFGQVIFAVDDHLLLQPSFYADDAAPLGMHGYLPGCRDNESAFVIVGDGIPQLPARDSADMRRLFHTMVGLLGAPAAVNAALPSLLQ